MSNRFTLMTKIETLEEIQKELTGRKILKDKDIKNYVENKIKDLEKRLKWINDRR